jgi:hypothetical protein
MGRIPYAVANANALELLLTLIDALKDRNRKLLCDWL